MNKINLILEVVIVFFILQMLFFGKEYIIGTILLVAYILYKYFTKRVIIIGYKAAVAFNSRDFEKSLALYEKAYSMYSVTDSIKLRYAYSALYCGKLDICNKVLNSITYSKLTDVRQQASYKQTKGLCEWKNGDLDKAIEIYQTLDKDYEHTSVYESLGYLLLLKKDYDASLEYNLKAYEYDSDSNVIVDNLAQSYYFKGDHAKSKEIYEGLFNKEATKKPSFSEAYFYYGIILKDEGNTEEAINYLNTALEKRESYLSALKHDTIREVLQSLEKSKAS